MLSLLFCTSGYALHTNFSSVLFSYFIRLNHIKGNVLFLLNGLKKSNPLQGWIFSGFIFTTARVVFITAKIAFIFMSLLAVQIYDFPIPTIVSYFCCCRLTGCSEPCQCTILEGNMNGFIPVDCKGKRALDSTEHTRNYIKTVSVLSRHTECASEKVYSLEAILVKNKSTT